jgi:hypothetical protein
MVKAEAVVLLTRAEFARLGEYSCSIPTGVTIGKRWKRNLNARGRHRPPLLRRHAHQGTGAGRLVDGRVRREQGPEARHDCLVEDRVSGRAVSERWLLRPEDVFAVPSSSEAPSILDLDGACSDEQGGLLTVSHCFDLKVEGSTDVFCRHCGLAERDFFAGRSSK